MKELFRRLMRFLERRLKSIIRRMYLACSAAGAIALPRVSWQADCRGLSQADPSRPEDFVAAADENELANVLIEWAKECKRRNLTPGSVSVYIVKPDGAHEVFN